MPTNQNAYNSRVTDETLEKKFRDTFKSQGGAELVDDLYASGVIVPVVDFTSAAQGSELRSDLQSAWDFATNSVSLVNQTDVSLITTPGFWQVGLTSIFLDLDGSDQRIQIFDGATEKDVWRAVGAAQSGTQVGVFTTTFVCFLRSGDILRGTSSFTNKTLNIWYRQIADVSGNLVNPLGFTSS